MKEHWARSARYPRGECKVSTWTHSSHASFWFSTSYFRWLCCMSSPPPSEDPPTPIFPVFLPASLTGAERAELSLAKLILLQPPWNLSLLLPFALQLWVLCPLLLASWSLCLCQPIFHDRLYSSSLYRVNLFSSPNGLPFTAYPQPHTSAIYHILPLMTNHQIYVNWGDHCKATLSANFTYLGRQYLNQWIAYIRPACGAFSLLFFDVRGAQSIVGVTNPRQRRAGSIKKVAEYEPENKPLSNCPPGFLTWLPWWIVIWKYKPYKLFPSKIAVYIVSESKLEQQFFLPNSLIVNNPPIFLFILPKGL